MSEETKPKILLIEDDKMIVDMYKMRLESEDYEVIVTDKGSEVIELAKAHQPVVILLDIILPETDGFSILQILKKDVETKNIPIMLLTNLGQESDQEKGVDMGANDYLIKSQHTPADVIVKINKLIKKK